MSVRSLVVKPASCFFNILAVFLLIILSGAAGPLAAQPIFQIIDIGLTGSEHTRSNGFKLSEGQQLNQAGQVRGYSGRFNGGSSNLGRTAWLYDGTSTIDIGLIGVEHTRSDGYKLSESLDLNEAGMVRGYSERFNGGGSNLGRSAWLYNGIHTIDISLTGVEHTRSDGYRFSTNGLGQLLNEAGQVTGYALRFNGGGINLGRSAWLYNGTSTLDIGLTGVEHTRSNGHKYSESRKVNQAGQVYGFSYRYNGGTTDLGQSTWLYNGTNTIDIGLTGSEHTRSNGYKYSLGQQLNEAGQVIGYANRYNGGTTDLGRSAWLYNGAVTIDIGLTGSEHSRNDGYKFSSYVGGQHLNQAGQVSGYSDRFLGGGTNLGRSAWFYNGSSTIDIGLTGSEHTRHDGYKFSMGLDINEAGQIIGYSDRYSGGVESQGQSAWLYNGTSTIDIGLTGVEHTNNVGARQSGFGFGQQLNQAGQVTGYSRRFNGGNYDFGQTAWLYNGTSTIDIGLIGSEHTRDDGYKFSTGSSIADSGHVIGYSERFDGAIELGQDAWVYDPSLGTVALQLSVRSDGWAFSEAAFLGDEGIVLGYYQLFDDMNLLGDRAFYWSASDGLWDLGSVIDGGLVANGWESLYYAIQGNGLGQIMGNGLASGINEFSRSAYLVTAIPEPSSAALLLAGILFPMILAGRRRG